MTDQVPSKDASRRELLLRADYCIRGIQTEDWRVVMNDLAAELQRAAAEPAPVPVRAWMRMFEDGTWDVTHATWKWRKSDRTDPKQWEVIPLYERPAQPPRDGQ